MGWSLSWLAIKGKSAQAVCNELGFRPTGVFEDKAESQCVGVELPTGWYLIQCNRNERVVPDTLLQQVSVGCEAVTCFLEEHVMYSIVTGWKDGHKRWTIPHDAQSGIEHLVAEGDLPDQFNSIRARLRARQQEAGGQKAEVDYIFDIPIETAQALVSYRYDHDTPGLDDEPFELLVPPPPEKSSFWKRLFG